MEALVIVHTGTCYLDLQEVGEDGIEPIKAVFDKIAIEIRQRIGKVCKIYLLSEGETYPPIRESISDMTCIPPGIKTGHTVQFLELKEKLIADGVDSVTIAGISSEMCIPDLTGLLTGQDSPEIFPFEYEEASQELGWSREKLEKVMKTIIQVSIDDQLVV